MLLHPTRIYDVTVPVTPALPVWPGDPAVTISAVTRIADGGACNLSYLSCSNHTGTHVDAPWHFLETGARLDEIPLERWVGPCYVADLRAAGSTIDPPDLAAAGIPGQTLRLLLRTRNSDGWMSWSSIFEEDYVALSAAAAAWIVESGIRLVGIDGASVDPFHDEAHPAHHTLLGNDVLIIENLDLARVAPGPYELVCLPLKLDGLDGAPARVMLMGGA